MGIIPIREGGFSVMMRHVDDIIFASFTTVVIIVSYT